MSAFAFDESRKVEPVSKYDFVPFVEISDNEKKRKDNSDVLTDPDFHCNSYFKKTSTSKEEELLEPVEKCTSCGFIISDSSITNSSDFFKVKLSNYLDTDKRNRLKYFVSLHRTGQFDISFDVIKGNNQANDPDGYIKAEIIPTSTKGISISCSPENGGNLFEYNKKIKLKLNVEQNESFITNIHFYSEDNNKDSAFDWQGDIKERIHCGEIGIMFYKCICYNWSIINPVVSENDFVGWPSSGSANCFDLAKKQIAKASCQLAESGYDRNSLNIFQIFQDTNSDRVNDLTGENHKKRFKECIDYIKDSLKKGIPLIAGVDYDKGHTGNGDSTTDHYITLIGTGKDKKGCFILFYDNAVGYSGDGASSNNKLYCDCVNFKLFSESGHYVNRFVSSTGYKQYFVTHVRKSIKVEKK